MILLEWLALLASSAVLLAVGVVATECFAAVVARRRPSRWTDPTMPRPKTVVLVPACDEEELLPLALGSIADDLAPQDRILVVAHNCTDRTAEVARARGAEALEVRDDGTGGKPAALRAGLEHLDHDPPEVVVVIDADCDVAPGSIAALARMTYRHGGPVQASYLFEAPADAERPGLTSLSSLAVLIKNFVRPLGLHELDKPCLINGSGSAFPFLVLRNAPQGEGSIAEDYQLAIDLARRGYPTRFCPEAEVTSLLPGERAGARKQRRRWEHGHLQLSLHTAPRLFLEAVKKGDSGLGVLALDLAVPPLASLVLLWFGATALGGLLAALGRSPLALGIGIVSGTLLALGLGSAWLRYAGLRRTLSALLGAPRYVVSKVPLYLSYWRRRETGWRKTPRDGAAV